MAPPRRGGRSRSLAPPELRGALGALLRTTLEQASAVRDALERGAREGRARLDDALGDRRRTEALADLGDVVLRLIQRGKFEELAEHPDVAEAVAAIEELEERKPARRERERDDDSFVVPESRKRFDRDRPRERDDTVASKDWRPPPARSTERVWRPVKDEPEKPARPVKPVKKGGIVFPAADDDAAGDEDDLAAYMNPEDVPPRK